MRTHESYADRGVVFVSLTPEKTEKLKAVQGFVDKFDISWEVGYEAGRTINALGVTGFPTTFVVGRDGKVLWNDELGGELTAAIDRALGG